MMKAPMPTKDFEPMPAGNYVARLYQIIYIGTVPVVWQGVEKQQYKVRFTFEFPTEQKVFKEENGEQPYVLSTEMTLSMSPKSRMRPMIESWLGKKMTDAEAVDYDIDDLLGREAMVNVVHTEKDGNTYANISTVSSLAKGLKVPVSINEPKILDYHKNWDEDFFKTLPEFIRNKIMSSVEYRAMTQRGDEPRDEKSESQDDTEEINLEEVPF